MDKEINYVHTEEYHNTGSPSLVLPYIIQLISPSNILDVGCGTGTWLSVAKQLGVKDVKGVDGIHVDRKLMKLSDDEFLQQNLTHPLVLNRKFDLVICLEVAEHLPDNAADGLVNSLVGHADIVLFSAGIPGQGGQYHINEQWPSYWQKKFQQHGFVTYDFLRDKFWEEARIQWWYKQNMFIFAKPGNARLNAYQPVEKIKNLVHPDLLEQINTDLTFYSEMVKRPKFLPSLKLLVKSILRK
ncbi:MAG: class I SAM-dependent methyltransferase [Bacteroidetes bacterium]|nr:class I SAM-dependent methyltransferase [Bacteroidota bacterium]